MVILAKKRHFFLKIFLNPKFFSREHTNCHKIAPRHQKYTKPLPKKFVWPSDYNWRKLLKKGPPLRELSRGGLFLKSPVYDVFYLAILAYKINIVFIFVNFIPPQAQTQKKKFSDGVEFEWSILRKGEKSIFFKYWTKILLEIWCGSSRMFYWFKGIITNILSDFSSELGLGQKKKVNKKKSNASTINSRDQAIFKKGCPSGAFGDHTSPHLRVESTLLVRGGLYVASSFPA